MQDEPANRSFDETFLNKIKGPSGEAVKKTRKKVHMKKKLIINNCKKKVERSMVSMFGSVEAMDMFVEPGSRKVRYIFECPIEGCDFRGNNLSRHLSGKRHGWSAEKAKLTHSYRVRLFNYVTKVDKNRVS